MPPCWPSQKRAGVADEGLDLLAVIGHPGLHVVHGVGLGAVDLGKDQVLPLQDVRQTVPELVRIQQLTGHDGLFLVLVGVEGSDALLGGAVLLVLEAGLLQTVQVPVPGQQQRGTVADLQVLGGDGNALAGNIGDLGPQALAVQRHAVAQNVHDTLAENAGGQQVQCELALLVDDGVAGVAAALITDQHVTVLSQQVHHAALSLIAPVDTYDGAI